MSESLPITLRVEDSALNTLVHIASVTNKLEAQLNFITMTAGWYADPDNELNIEFHINVTPFFPEQQFPISDEFFAIADDVHLAYCAKRHHYHCYVEITSTELKIAALKKAVLNALLDKKLTIVLNAIAKKQNLSTI